MTRGSNTGHAPTPEHVDFAVPSEDWTILKLLTVAYPNVPLRQKFRQSPYLKEVTLRQVLDGPFALNDFLDQCRRESHCGGTSVMRLRDVIEHAAIAMARK
ncbi:hypothetical protein [Roseicyclus mahoneyensis]|uniref:Uncharacterized protein n=1 Tax=Roseicyclus mahoneyensis TaxID=164332 RepID=A0A316GNM4_9RHOB|nr:hypothetical protein [Roseicyclus mahoneyensis]PWK62645.1 hypothetical protein C7455_101674 [Roseicyclus mahoneyensis]